LKEWLQGVAEPDPISALGLQPWRPEIAPLLAELDPQGPAYSAGFQVGDVLLALNGAQLTQWQQVVEQVRGLAGQGVVFAVQRKGQVIDVPVILASRREANAVTGYLGAGVGAPAWPADMLREVSFGPAQAVIEGLQRTWTMSVLTLDSMKKMLIGELSVKNLSGPITIAKVAGASAQSGFGDFLNFLAYLSISLGVLNLLPIPVLDGGHLLFYLVEWVRGRPLSDRVQAWGMQIGISMIVGVMLLALVNDLGRL
jgi:regulator of sigma E protease